MGWGMGKATNEDYFEVLDETDHGSILDGDTLIHTDKKIPKRILDLTSKFKNTQVFKYLSI